MGRHNGSTPSRLYCNFYSIPLHIILLVSGASSAVVFARVAQNSWPDSILLMDYLTMDLKAMIVCVVMQGIFVSKYRTSTE
jgi:multisubunit Na+/H+ antiporter MnhF subunit